MRQHVTTTEVKVWLSEEKGKEREGEKTKTRTSFFTKKVEHKRLNTR